MMKTMAPRAPATIRIFGAAVLLHGLLCAGTARAATPDAYFMSLDKNQDGVLSGSEATPVIQYDRDADGEVTVDEYFTGQNEALKKFLELDDNQVFATYDRNQDGKLAGREKPGFERYDRDGDGEVTRKEFDEGRASERQKMGIGTVGPEERQRLAREAFRKLDINEDGRLSGRELFGFEKLDANQDRRVTEQEFVAGYEPLANPVETFLEMIRAGRPQPLLALTDPEFAKEVDMPLLEYSLASLYDDVGQLKSTAADLAEQKRTVEGRTRSIYSGKLKFVNQAGAEQTVDATLVVADGRVARFDLKCPTFDRLPKRLHAELSEPAAAMELANAYNTLRCEEFVRQILEGDYAGAFAKYHPSVQKQIGREKSDAVFAALKQLCGDFQRIEVESAEVEPYSDTTPWAFKVTERVYGTRGEALATFAFQFVANSGKIVGLSVKKAGPKPKKTPAGPLQVPAAIPAAPQP